MENIKKRIEELNACLESLVIPGTYVLNKDVVNIMEEITKLQNECSHTFESGYCIFCGLEGDE